ncbi:MAG: hypothetical protein IJ157_13390 [Clostridia bacterium]|nr:hypothetical protein [Clostridia bacterium]
MKKLYICLLAACLLLCRAQAEPYDLKEWAVSGLTEVLGYTTEEAAAFVFEPQPDGSLRYWQANHPDWAYATYYDEASGAVRSSTPFKTDYTLRTGEGVLRDILRTAEEQGWLASWGPESKDALIDCCLADISSLSSALRFAESASQAVQGIFESCFGPEAHWPAALGEYRGAVLAQYGLVPEEIPFHRIGVFRQTGPDQPMTSIRTLTVFDGEAPEELRDVFADPRLDGWKLASGATSLQDWGE